MKKGALMPGYSVESKGKTYYLHQGKGFGKGAKKNYFFTTSRVWRGQEPVEKPDGATVAFNKRTGLPYLKISKG